MGDHVNECMTYRNRLKALGAAIPREFFVQKLLDVDKEYMFMHASLRTQSTEQIVAALMEQYQLFQRHKNNDRRVGSAPAGQNRPTFNRPRGQGRPPAVAVAAIGKGGVCLRGRPVDDGRVWSHMSDVLHNNEAACEIAAVQNEGMEYVCDE